MELAEAKLAEEKSSSPSLYSGANLVPPGGGAKNPGVEALDPDAIREAVFASLTDPKDKLILCLPEIAAAEYERASERDKPGWALFQEGINKWLNLPAYIIKDAYDNGPQDQEPLWVEWDWLMQYGRFQRTVDGMLTERYPPQLFGDKNYLFGPEARALLRKIMKDEDFGEPGTRRDFDHIHLPWNQLRSHAFQSMPMDSFEGTWGTAEGTPDGLAVIGNLTLFAVAKGYTRVSSTGARSIYVKEVGLFIHDGFEFSKDQWLGNWECSEQDKGYKSVDAALEAASEFLGKELGLPSRLDNRAFRNFRVHSGYGCDFRIMCKPKVYLMQGPYNTMEVEL